MLTFTFQFSGRRFGATLTTKPYRASSLREAQAEVLEEHKMFNETDIEYMEILEETGDTNNRYFRGENGGYTNFFGEKYPLD